MEPIDITTPNAKALYNTAFEEILRLVLVLCNIQPLMPRDLSRLNSFNEKGTGNILPWKILSTLKERGHVTQHFKGAPYIVQNKIHHNKYTKDEIWDLIDIQTMQIYNLIKSRFVRRPRKAIKFGPLNKSFQNTLERKGCLEFDSIEGVFSATHIKPTHNTPQKSLRKNSSRGETMTEYVLNSMQIEFYRECSPEGFGRQRCDFFIENYNDSNIIIEYDGIQHSKSVEFFGGEEQLMRQKEKDQLKNTIAKSNNYHMLRLNYLTHQSTTQIEHSIKHFLSSIQNSKTSTPLFITV